MNYCFKVTILFFWSFSLFAADIPPVVQGAEQYDSAMCEERTANDCINTICLTSEARDCIQKCKSSAKDKCENAQN